MASLSLGVLSLPDLADDRFDSIRGEDGTFATVGNPGHPEQRLQHLGRRGVHRAEVAGFTFAQAGVVVAVLGLVDAATGSD